jgi:hypothetical protein
MSNIKSLEMYKPVKNFENRYLVNENGQIFSILKGKILKPMSHKLGYLYYDLRKDKKRKLYYVHRLVSEHFIDNPLSKKYVNHIDGNKKNNSISNLEWVTSKENVNHAIKTGLIKRVKLKLDDVRIIKELIKRGDTCISISKKFNVTPGCISGIKYNNNWSSHL